MLNKIILFFSLTICFHSYAEIITTKHCTKIYKEKFKTKKFKLFTIYESKTLCGFVMNKNTISFNKKTMAPDQVLSKSIVKTLEHKGKWINIFGKDENRDLLDDNLSDAGINENELCLTKMPIKFSIQCPKLNKNIFKILAKHKGENFIKVVF